MSCGRSFLWARTITILLCLAQAARGQDMQVSASVTSDTVGVLDQFRLTITVSGGESGSVTAPILPRLQDFKVVQGPDTSTQFQWINGKTSSSKTFSYTLIPDREGQFTIDPVEIRLGGKSYKTQALTIRVVSGAVAGRASPRPRRADPFMGDDDLGEETRTRIGENDIFLTAELNRSSAYTGQQVTLSYHLYTKIAISGLQLQDSPPLTGFWVEGIDVPANPTGSHKLINGEEYLEYIVKKQALFPTGSGRLKIPPSTFAVSARASGDLFGFFRQTQTIYRKTKEAVLDVKPLPEANRPANFSNAVGTFNLTSSLDKTRAATGEAVSLRLKLEGRGNLKLIPDIALPQLPDFTVYSSKRSDNVRTFEGDALGGDKTWEYVMVAKAPGRQILPSLSFSYFNPENEKYETVSTMPLSLEVVAGTNTRSSFTDLSGISKHNLTRQGTDINFIKLNAGDLRPDPEPIYHRAWFYLLIALPFLANTGIFLYQKGRANENGNAILARTRKARRLALDALKNAEKRGRSEPRHFYDGAALALARYLSDKFTLPEIAVTADSLERALSEKAVPPEVVKETVACLQECDFARFVSASTISERMGEISSRIRKVIDAMERI